MSQRTALEAALRDRGRSPDETFDLAGTALLLAALDRPRVSLDRYRDHLGELAAAGQAAHADSDDVGAGAASLRQIMTEQQRYRGDDLTYDNMQNANLMRVIDRRQGLPVALGILYIHTARAAGFQAVGLEFPAHFLIRIEFSGARLILDPFNGGEERSVADLRELLARLSGGARELGPDCFEVAADRDILLRLLNNIRSRAVQRDELARAATIGDRMLMLAPYDALLHREQAVTCHQAANIDQAIDAAERYLTLAEGESQGHDAALLLQRLKTSLN